MNQTIKTSTAAAESGRSSAVRVDHFTVEERMALGKATR